MTTSAPSATSAPSMPAAIGRFHVQRVLGQGGQGIVYLAYDPQLDREVAIKTLTRRARDQDKLLNEARNAAQLEHPNIVGLFAIELDHAPPYLVYQYAPGRPLASYCAGTDILPIKRAVQIMISVLDAMHYAHQRHILHRDLTPNNILIDDNDHPRILDFGISIALNDGADVHTIAGTPNYLAPEVLSNVTAGPQADLYALSVVLHELLCGRRLFHADNPMAVIYKIINERVLPPSMSRAEVDGALDQIVMHGLEKNPAQRYQSAGAMRDALQDYLRPQQPIEVGRNVNEVKGAVAFLQRRMTRKPDFPAVSRHIAEFNRKADAGAHTHVNDLASLILQDYSLTTKLLKVVNSAVYGQYGGSISTVSRAVVILGLDQVRALTVGIIMFEHMKNGEQANLLKEAACSSFLSAMLARTICTNEIGVLHAEEAFVGALFHRLGRQLAIYYFPEEYSEVLALIANKEATEAAAAREIFGADFAEFGIAVGHDWQLPERLLQAMRPQRPDSIQAGKTPEQRVAQICAFSNEAAEIAARSAHDLDQSLAALLVRYRDCVTVDTTKLKVTIADAATAAGEYAGLIGVELGGSHVLGRIERAMNESTQTNVVPTVLADLPVNSDTPLAADRQLFLTKAISELTTAIIDGTALNDMFTMVLEALYRSMAFTHVLLLLRDTSRKSFVTRFGFGADIEHLKARFEHKLSAQEDIFAQAVQKGRNAVIIDTSDERYREAIPGWCCALTQPRSILLFAVIVNKICIGMIYADTCTQMLRVSAQELQLLNTLVKQLTLGVRRP